MQKININKNGWWYPSEGYKKRLYKNTTNKKENYKAVMRLCIKCNRVYEHSPFYDGYYDNIPSINLPKGQCNKCKNEDNHIYE